MLTCIIKDRNIEDPELGDPKDALFTEFLNKDFCMKLERDRPMCSLTRY